MPKITHLDLNFSQNEIKNGQNLFTEINNFLLNFAFRNLVSLIRFFEKRMGKSSVENWNKFNLNFYDV